MMRLRFVNTVGASFFAFSFWQRTLRRWAKNEALEHLP